MIKKLFYILILYSCVVCSQNDKLRVEIIDVFKEHDPDIINSTKISYRPTFKDTLITPIMSNKAILNKSLLTMEDASLIYPSKFRFFQKKLYYQKHLSINVGNHAFLNAKFHYTSGFSTKHNSGVYIEHHSKNFLLNRALDGRQFTFLQAYSNRFWNQKILSAVCNFNRTSGFYWGNLEAVDPDSVKKYSGNNFDIHLDLNETSTESILDQCDVSLNYFASNEMRHELILNPSIDLKVEQALRKYLLHLDFKLTHTMFNPDTQFSINNSTYNRFRSIESFNSFSDLLISSKLLFSGNKVFNYNLGLNFQYLPSDIIKYGNKPLIFPEINLLKNINANQRVELNVSKELIYHSFNHVFKNMPYVDPYYRNSISKQFQVNILYSKKINKSMSFSNNFSYLRERGSLIPFVFSQIFNDELFNQQQMNPLGIYHDQLQRGFTFSSSLSIDKLRYGVLFDGTWNWIRSRKHDDKQFVPKWKFNSIITLKVTDDFHVLSNWSFVGKRNVLTIMQLNDPNQLINYSEIDSYLKTDFSFNYNINAMTFSLEMKNILGQKIDFFDGYYDDDGFRIITGFTYKF